MEDLFYGFEKRCWRCGTLNWYIKKKDGEYFCKSCYDKETRLEEHQEITMHKMQVLQGIKEKYKRLQGRCLMWFKKVQNKT